MMDALLIQPRWGRVTRFPSRPPLGLAYVAGALRGVGWESRIVDLQVEEVAIEPLIERAAPRLVGFSITTWTYKEVLAEAARLKAHFPGASGVRFVAGGPHATALPGQVLAGGFDAVVRGYGEETIAALAARLDRPDLWEDVPGLSYNHEGAPRHNPDRQPLASLEDLPAPAFDLLDLARYAWCSVSSSRGCPAACLFCADSHLFSRRVALRSPRAFVDELEQLYKERGVRRFYIVDEQFTFDEARAGEICRDILGRRLALQWMVNARADRVSSGLLRLMREAGCISVAFGVESGSDAILRRVRKGFRAETALAAVRMAKEAGLRVKTSWIVGLPGTFDEQLASIDLMQAMEPNHIDVFLLTIYPGTPLWHRAEEFGITIDRDDPPMMSTEKLHSDRYRLSYLDNEEILQVASRMEEAMASRGYRMVSPGGSEGASEEDFDPGARTMTTFLRHFPNRGGW